MDGYIKIYFRSFKNFLAPLVQNFEKHNITLKNPGSQSIFFVDVTGQKKINFQQLSELSNAISNNYFSFQFWIAANSDVFTSIKRRYDIFEFVFYLDGLEDEEIDQVELAVNDFIKENREKFLLKIVDPRGYHEEIDWFNVMLTQYKLPDKE